MDRGKIAIAIAGKVPCKVTTENGPIKPGDLLTTSSKPGYAMKCTFLDPAQAKDFEELKYILKENLRRRKAVVGKALEGLEKGEGQILVLLVVR